MSPFIEFVQKELWISGPSWLAGFVLMGVTVRADVVPSDFMVAQANYFGAYVLFMGAGMDDGLQIRQRSRGICEPVWSRQWADQRFR